MNDNLMLVICPGCRCLSPFEIAVCPRCGRSIGWVRRLPNTSAALTVNPSSAQTSGPRLELSVTVTWAAGEGNFRGPVDRALVIPVPGAPDAHVSWAGRSTELTLAVGGLRKDLVVGHPYRHNGVEILAWLEAVPRPEIRRQTAVQPLSRTPYFARSSEVTVGRHDTCMFQIPPCAVDLVHCVLVRMPDDGTGGGSDPDDYWIIDNQSETGTFVNRESIIAHRLTGGDILQIGAFQWTFNESDGFLLPLDCVGGVALVFEDVELLLSDERGRYGLQVLPLKIAKGEFVAISGPSGSGKSTLLKLLAGVPINVEQGTIRADGRDISKNRGWYRSILGYLSQEPIVHDELTARQILAFSQRLRSAQFDESQIERTLEQLDVPKGRWDGRLKRLSGGEEKRVRIGSELIAGPRLLLLDEPASGLDHVREKALMRMLRTLSWRGCTVVVVTHGTEVALCDRVLVVESGTLREKATGGSECGCRDDQGLAPQTKAACGPSVPNSPDDHVDPYTSEIPGPWRQFRTLISREVLLLASSPFRRLVLPLFVVPAIFAGAFAVALDRAELVGFFSVLASVWMGASQTLLAIVGEREVFDHEHLLFLRIRSYVLAKTAVFGLLGIVQTVVLVGLLYGFGRLTYPRAQLVGFWWVFGTLSLVNLASVGMGLLISVAVGRISQAANLILPLVMIVQIVFSVHVCRQGGTLQKAYGEFSPWMCSLWPSRRADQWRPGALRWICEGALEAYEKHRGEMCRVNANAPNIQPACEHQAIGAARADDPHDAQEDAFANARLPSRAAAAISYLTLSRYGDIILRSFAYRDESPDPTLGYEFWWKEALLVIATIFAGSIAATAAVLQWQSQDHSVRQFLQHCSGRRHWRRSPRQGSESPNERR